MKKFESAYENLGRVGVPKSIDFENLEDILVSKYIDPPMREIVYWFNKCGFITDGHCYGHTKESDAFISFRDSNIDDKFFELIKINGVSWWGTLYKQLWKMTAINNEKYPYGTIMFFWRWSANSKFKDDLIQETIKLLKKYYR